MVMQLQAAKNRTNARQASLLAKTKCTNILIRWKSFFLTHG